MKTQIPDGASISKSPSPPLPNRVITVPAVTLKKLLDQVDKLTEMVQEIHEREASKPTIDPKARYHLSDAAEYLNTSTSTLKRRAARHKLVILYDGKTPFVMGAELLRYAREGAQRKPHRSGSRKKRHKGNSSLRSK